MSLFYDTERPAQTGKHNLPHWQQEEVPVFVTFSLADSLPESQLNEWKRRMEEFRQLHPEPWDDETRIEFRKQFTDEMEAWLDRGYGECQLRLPEIRSIVENAFSYFDSTRYRLLSYVIMPNHVHILFEPITPNLLPDILHSLKSFTANKINKALGLTGPLWMRDYHDRLIRSEKHLFWAQRYIANNPKKLPANSYTLWKR